MRGTVIVVFIVTLIQAFALTPQRSHAEGDHSKHKAGSKMIASENETFMVGMELHEESLKIGDNTISLIIQDSKGGQVNRAKVTVTPWMSEMGHGVFEKPLVEEKENGIYKVDNIILAMGGHWELRVNISWKNKKDNIIFDFPSVKTMKEYNYIKADTPAGFNAVIGSKNSLKELKTEVITEKGKEIKVFHMTVEDVKFEIFPGRMMDGWGFNGQIPGPTIRVTEGDTVRIILINNQKEEHTLHVHGQSKPMIMDGVPYLGQKPLKKGESYTYEFVVKNIGTSWYHCHVDSAHHVDMGMYGAFIVEPAEEKLKYDREYTMLLDEWPTAHIHIHEDVMPMEGHDEHGVVTKHEGPQPMHMDMDMDEKPGKRDWYPKTHKKYEPVYDGFTINGRSFPFTEPIEVKEGEKVRIRFINVGYQSHFMHTHSHKFQVVARDGSPVQEDQKIDTVEIGPGQRVDIILLADNPGIWPFHCHRLNHVTNEDIYPGGLLTFIRYIE